MFGKTFTLFRMQGFAVRIDASWPILALLVTWTLALGYFPFAVPGLSSGVYWGMAGLGALGLFASIVAHEFAHAVVARRYGIPIKGISLFIFGGVAEMDGEPPSATAELRMALAGPAMSVLLALLGFIVYGAIAAYSPVIWIAVVGYLAAINLLLAVFNMLPAFPLDGGRVLRAFLWGRRNDLRSATRTASRWGEGFGIGLMVLGAINFLFGNFVGGMWWILIGLFLRTAAKATYQQAEFLHALEGVPVSRFVREAEDTVPPTATLQDLMDFYFQRHYVNVYPIADGSQLTGCVDVRKLKGIPRQEWASRPITGIAERCGSENTIDPSADAADALKRMSRGGRGWLMVAEHGRLHGMVTLRDLLNYVMVKIEIESPAAAESRDPVDPVKEEAPGRR